MPDETEESNSFLKTELETLKSIYIDELIVENDDVGKPEKISIDLFPATADKVDEQYVRITLIFNFSEEYPEKLPEINIRNPRGLSDEMLNRLTHDLSSIAEERKGNSMIFELIQSAKEHLTIENRPSGQCSICLHDFRDTDVFTRTECFHYFHSYCLSRYSLYIMQCDEDKHPSNEAMSETSKKELLCPMCRVPIAFQNMEAEYPPPPSSADEDTFALNQELCELQKKMADLYQKQIDKGGIIDIEVEKNKYLLEISNVPTCSNPVDKSNSNSTSPIPETGESKLLEEKVSPSKSPNKRYPTEETEAKTQNYVKPASKQKFRKPEERRFEPQNNRYNYRRYNSYGNARDYRYSNYDSHPNRRPRNVPESRAQEKDPNSEIAHDSGEEIQNSNEPDLNSTNHNDSEETPADVKQFHPHNMRDQRYNARTRSGFQRKQFSGNSRERNSKSDITGDDISEAKASLPLNEEDKLSGSDQETSTAMRPSRYSKSEKYVPKTTRRDYSYRENNFNERYQSGNDAYNRQSDFQYNNNRPYRRGQQSQRRNYQSNYRNYQRDGERYDGYYSKPNRFNSRGSNRFNEVKYHVNNSSQETDVPENSIDAVETDGNVKEMESSNNDKNNSSVDESAAQLEVSNRPRRNGQKSGYRGRNNFRKADTRIKESYTQIKDSDTQIKDSDTQIKDTDTQIKDTDNQITDTDNQIKDTYTTDMDTQSQQTDRYNRKEARRYPKRDPELYNKRDHEQYNNRKPERYSNKERESYGNREPEHYTKRTDRYNKRENERYNNRDPDYYTKREPEHSYRKENETYRNGECKPYTSRENESYNKRDTEPSAKRDERYKRDPEDYHRNEPARYHRREPEHNRRERDYNNREPELNKRGERGDYYKRELPFNRNSNSNYHGPRRDSRDFQHNSHSRYSQASQDAECTNEIDDRNTSKFNRSKYSNQSEQQEQMEYPVVDKPPKDAPVIENHKTKAVSVADDVAVPDMYNSCHFPLIPAPHSTLPPPPGFANPSKKLIYGLSAANPPPGFHKS